MGLAKNPIAQIRKHKPSTPNVFNIEKSTANPVITRNMVRRLYWNGLAPAGASSFSLSSDCVIAGTPRIRAADCRHDHGNARVSCLDPPYFRFKCFVRCPS